MNWLQTIAYYTVAAIVGVVWLAALIVIYVCRGDKAAESYIHKAFGKDCL